ncbi:MAG: LacI family DNA-binding transcriptional regulator [Chthoniobacterales bacterium]
MKSHVHSTTQLADLLGLSRCTISRALNGNATVNPKTMSRIKEAALQHGFSPNILGRGLRAGKTNLVGICLPPVVEYALVTKISRLHLAIKERGFHPIMQMTDGSENEENIALESFSSMRCAGVFVIASQLEATASGMRSLSAKEIPIVMIDPTHATEHHVVTTDRAGGMCLALEHFHQLGHRSIVAMGFQDKGAYNSQRLQGLRKGCEALGWSFERDIHFLQSSLSDINDFATGADMAKTYISMPGKRIPAILAVNDNVALGAMDTLKASGLQIPEDVSIIGNNNSTFTAYIQPGLTTLDSQAAELIDHAIALLPTTGCQTPTPQHIVFHPQLIVRKSVAAPPTGL